MRPAERVPVLIHVADPAPFFEPIDYRNERWLELALFPNRAYPPVRFPHFAELMAERDRMFARHPKTRFINARFGWRGNDLRRAAKHLDTLPNVSLEVGAVLCGFGRQQRAAREFSVKYQDGILFGINAYEPSEYPHYWRVFETTDEYFDYYRDYHAFWKLYGMGLPDAVLSSTTRTPSTWRPVCRRPAGPDDRRSSLTPRAAHAREAGRVRPPAAPPSVRGRVTDRQAAASRRSKPEVDAQFQGQAGRPRAREAASLLTSGRLVVATSPP